MTDAEITLEPEFDATDLDMIRRGDMLGPRLGQRVYDALSRSTLPREGQGEVGLRLHAGMQSLETTLCVYHLGYMEKRHILTKVNELLAIALSPSPAVRDGVDDVRQLLMAIENAARMSEQGILSADGGQAATEIRALVPLKFRRALSTQEQGNG